METTVKNIRVTDTWTVTSHAPTGVDTADILALKNKGLSSYAIAMELGIPRSVVAYRIQRAIILTPVEMALSAVELSNKFSIPLHKASIAKTTGVIEIARVNLDKKKISAMLAAGESYAEIARCFKTHPSYVSRVVSKIRAKERKKNAAVPDSEARVCRGLQEN